MVRSAHLLDSATPNGASVIAGDLVWSCDGSSAATGLSPGPACWIEGRACVDVLDGLIVGTQSPIFRVVRRWDVVPLPRATVKLSAVEVNDSIIATGQG